MELVFSAIVIGITQVLKKSLGLARRYVPLTAVIVSLVIFFVASFVDSVVITWSGIQSALIAGLSGVGLYETGKKIIE